MCIACCKLTPDRRRFLSLSAAAAGMAAISILGTRGAFAAGAKTSVTADEALAKLKAGNEKFVAAPQLCAADISAQRDRVAQGQTPWATILSCSDSRVPPELLFGGLGVGELFIVRNAGNMADTAASGTIEYGAAELGVPLIVVMGHERCGAVAAACAVVEKHAKFPGSIGPMVAAIVPAARAAHQMAGDFIDNTVRASAKRTAMKVATKSKIVSHLVKANSVKVMAAYYSLDTGRVEFLT
jgi:carbonic anhydrase